MHEIIYEDSAFPVHDKLNELMEQCCYFSVFEKYAMRKRFVVAWELNGCLLVALSLGDVFDSPTEMNELEIVFVKARYKSFLSSRSICNLILRIE